MKKIILASASAIALLGLAACSDTDDTTTQSTVPEVQQTEPAAPTMTPTPPAADEPTTDDTTTQSVEPESPDADEPAATDDGMLDEEKPAEAPAQ